MTSKKCDASTCRLPDRLTLQSTHRHVVRVLFFVLGCSPVPAYKTTLQLDPCLLGVAAFSLFDYKRLRDWVHARESQIYHEEYRPNTCTLKQMRGKLKGRDSSSYSVHLSLTQFRVWGESSTPGAGLQLPDVLFARQAMYGSNGAGGSAPFIGSLPPTVSDYGMGMGMDAYGASAYPPAPASSSSGVGLIGNLPPK
jgi:hypothetical protein